MKNSRLLSKQLARLVLAAAVTCTIASPSLALAPFLPPLQVSDMELHGALNTNFFQVSEDGRRVVFLASQDFTQQLYSVSTGGGDIVRLNADLVNSGDVSVFSAISRDVSPFQVSPDSQTVVYVADQNSNDQFELYSVPIAGGDVVRLNSTLPGGGDVAATRSRPDFLISPDSERVVYIADQIVEGRFEIFSVPLEGGTPIQLNADFPIAGSDVVEFQISPDGQRVVYLADQDNNETFEIFSVSINGGAVERLNSELISQGDVDAFQISPDSSRVVYQADLNVFGDNELFSVPITGGNSVRLNGDFVASGGAASSDVFSFQISSDSQQVVYLADQEINGTSELFSVSILGGSEVRLNDELIGGGNVLEEFEISANNQTVVYVADQVTDNDFELFGVPLLGGTVTQLSPANARIASTQFSSLLPDNAFAIAPDSQQVVFLANFSGTTGELFSVPISGGSAVVLDSVAPGDIEENFLISSDSQRVLFTPQLSPRNLFSVPVTGGVIEQVNGDLPQLGNVPSFVISSDGQRIVYMSSEVGNLELFSVGDFPAPAAAILPSSRSVLVGDTATAFATVINVNSETLQGCSVAPPSGLAADFFYQTTDPDTNGLLGEPNTPATILPGGVQTYIFGITPTATLAPVEVSLQFDCTNSISASVFEGVNTLLLSGSQTPVADIVALGATPTGDGILTLADTTSSAAFAVASVNVGSAATVVASADTGASTPPLTLSICETNPANGQCLAPPAASVESTVADNATPTFSIFATANGAVPFDPANTRIRVRFVEAGEVRGSTSIAVRTQ